MQIKSINELNRLLDFDVAKYGALSSLNIVGWGEQLRYRAKLRWHLTNSHAAFDGNELKQVDAQLVSAVLGLIENPILPTMVDSDFNDRWIERTKSKPFDAYTVQSMVCGYVSWFPNDFERDELRYVLDACAADNLGNATEEQERIVQSPIDLAYQKAGIRVDTRTQLSLWLLGPRKLRCRGGSRAPRPGGTRASVWCVCGAG